MDVDSKTDNFLTTLTLSLHYYINTSMAWNGLASQLKRPVYTGDFCCSNSMQFLSHRSCNFKIARVNLTLQFWRDFHSLSPRYEIQLTKHGDFE